MKTKKQEKTNTSDIGDYQSLVLRSVRIAILLNHDNSFWTQLRLYEALDMVQEEQPKKFILPENANCSLMVAVFI